VSASLTAWALTQWAAALPAESYDVRLVPVGGGRATLRRFDAQTLARSAGWLRAMNAGRHHVYGRPLDERHVLVDDLDVDGLALLQAAHRAAAVVETSPGCHQAWVTLSSGPVPPLLAAAAARQLARDLGGDPGAASASQVGRLPGLANRKGLHERRDGSYPWARLRHAAAAVDPAGAGLLASLAPTVASAQGGRGAVGTPRTCLAAASPLDEWREAARRIAERLPPGAALDRSRVDAAVAARLLQRGAGECRTLAVVLAGEKAGELPHDQAQRYAARTVAAAAKATQRPAVDRS
jgi:hypothetical protein